MITSRVHIFNMRLSDVVKNMYNVFHQVACTSMFALIQVNKEPFSGGWLMKVKLSDKGELDSLLDASKYEEHCAKSEH